MGEGGQAARLKVGQVGEGDLLEALEEVGPRVEGRVEAREAVQEVRQALGLVGWLGGWLSGWLGVCMWALLSPSSSSTN